MHLTIFAVPRGIAMPKSARAASCALLMAAVAALAATGSHAAGASLSGSERTLLETQLKDHYKCELADVLFVSDIEVGGKKTLEGRARCKDQREVDFKKPQGHEKFELKLCEPTVC